MECNCAKSCQKTAANIRVIDQHHRVGANVELKNTLLETITQPACKSSHCIQTFLGNPVTYQVKKLEKSDLIKTRDYCDRNNKTFYIHAPLIANLSKDPGTKDDKDASILKKSWQALKSETEQLNGLPAGCVLHIGSKGTIPNLIRNLNDFDVPRNKHISQKKLLCLENAAGQGTTLGRNFEELRQIYEGIDVNSVGLCIDTAHIFGSGVNTLSTHEDVVKLFDDIEASYGGKPDVIHLNDSKVAFNKKVDRHENITSGYIWNGEKEGLRTLLNICYENDIDCILETPESCRDLDLIRSKYMDLQTIDTYREKIK